MKSTRRTFTKEFKEKAVELATSSKRSAQEVSESLAIAPSLLSKWIAAKQQEGGDAFRGQGKRTELEEANWTLQQRVKTLEQELEFLKKVSRYFAKDRV